jgi:transcriptional regulator with XRE-family HTH domain
MIMDIHKLRTDRGWSQEQVAEMAGLSSRTVQRVENGDKPSAETA